MTTGAGGGSASGFSLVELVVAMVVALVVASGAFSLVSGASAAFQLQPEAGDLQQRLRAASTALTRDLMAAGGAPFPAQAADLASPLVMPAVFPGRIGRSSADPPGSVSASRISIWSVATNAVQARLAAPLASASGVATIAFGSGCRSGAPSCGFTNGMTVVVFGTAGAWDLFTVTAVAGTSVTLQHNLRDAPLTHAATQSTMAEATARVYLLSTDLASLAPRLVRYDAAGGSDVPVVDHVADLAFEYVGEADPPSLVPGSDPAAPRVTYGPSPPAPGVQPTAYPPGENCVFTRTPAGLAVSRLASLGPGAALVSLPIAVFTDGPWCPDSTSPNRYDADLLRVRGVVAAIRVEAAVDSLRGPAGVLFARGGTARGTRVVPDRVSRVVSFPRGLNAWR